MQSIPMGEMRRWRVAETLTALEQEERLGLHDRSKAARLQYELRRDYLQARLTKFRDEEETLSQVEWRDFGWTPDA